MITRHVAKALLVLLLTTPTHLLAGGSMVLDAAVGYAKDRVVNRGKEILTSYVNASPPINLPTGGFEKCAHLFPNGSPIDIKTVAAQWRPRALCASNYAVIYSGLSKTPLLVIENLTREQIEDARDEVRTEEFFHDPRIPKDERAELTDFQGSGFDRGHMAPAADMPNQRAMAESFALSNMVPQDPTNNRKIWSKIESDTRKFVRRATGNVFVFSGPLFKGQLSTMGRNQVWVPTHFFKLVYDAANNRAWAHLLANRADATIGRPLEYHEFIAVTQWRPLPTIPVSATQ